MVDADPLHSAPLHTFGDQDRAVELEAFPDDGNPPGQAENQAPYGVPLTVR